MKAQTAQRGFPTALLTFSVMLLVLAIGFVVGRVVVAPAYLGAAPKIEAQGVGGSELDARRSAPGHVYVPSPSGSQPPDDAGEKGERASEGSARGQPAEAEQGEARIPVPEEPIQGPEGASPDEREQGRVGGAASARQGGARAQEPQPGEEKTSKAYSIQVGVFSSLQGARQVVDELARAGYPARISPDKRGAQTLYRVVTGRYQSEYAARKALGQLRTEGFDAFLIEQ